MRTIVAECFTVDEKYKDVKWPSSFAFPPQKGDMVQAVSEPDEEPKELKEGAEPPKVKLPTRLTVVGVLHTSDGQGNPVAKVALAPMAETK